MRDTNDTSFIGGIARAGKKALPLAIMLAGLTPLQALAAGEEVCNTDVHVTGVLGPTPYFVGDELILEAFIAADLIRDNARPGGLDGSNPYIDFTGIGYGVDCGGGKDLDTQGCFPTGYPDESTLPWGHDIEFLGVTGSDCTDNDGGGTNWPLPEADNIVSIPALNPPVRLEYDPATGEGAGCNVDMKFRVNALHESSNWVVQAVGVPYYAGEGDEDDMVGQCSNGLFATSYGKTVFAVNTCDISVNKQVSLDGETWSDAAAGFNGDDVYYRIVLTNTGTAPLVGSVIVNDPMLSVADVPVNADGLNPDETLVIDGGLIENFNFTASCETESTVVNTAGVEAWCRGSDGSEFEVSASMEDTASLSCAPLPPRIDLVKTADPLIYSYVEQAINYSFLVTNSGSVALSDVKVEDPLPGLSTITCPETQLAVGEAMTCTASYMITQDDLDAKSVFNTATAYGTSPDNKIVSDQDSANITTTAVYELALVKTADPLFYEAAGEDIAYTYKLTNSGNQTLYPPYVVEDDKTTVQCPESAGPMAPGGMVTCTAKYTITATDVMNRSVTNKATAYAMNAPAAGAGSQIKSNLDDETVVYRGIELTAVDMCVNDVPWVSYSFDVFGFPDSDEGDVTYSWYNVDDPDNSVLVKGPLNFTAGSGYSGYLLWPGAGATDGPGANPPAGDTDDSWPVGTKWPGWTVSDGVWTFTDTDEVPQLELRVSINPTDAKIVSYPDATPNCAPPASFKVDKFVESVIPAPAAPGMVDVTYKIKVTNTGGQKGNYDLVDTLKTDDAFAPKAVQKKVAYLMGTENETTGAIQEPTAASFLTGATLVTDEELEVGLYEFFTVTLRFEVDKPNVTVAGSNCEVEEGENGKTGFLNHVDVLVDDQIVDQAEDCKSYPLGPSVTIEKQILDNDGEVEFWNNADTPGTAPVRKHPSGAMYQVIVTNTGIVGLENLEVTDPTLGLTYKVPGILPAGKSVTINSSTDGAEVLDQENSVICDKTGDFKNTASVSGNGVNEGNPPVSASNDAYLSCVGTPGLSVLKEICVEEDCSEESDNWLDADTEENAAGPVSTPSGALYRITVENTGNVELLGVTVADSRFKDLFDPYVVGDMKAKDIVVITEAEWPYLRFDTDDQTPNLPACSTSGVYQNIATANGTSAELETDTIQIMDDAHIQCIGDPAISILKEVSLDGGENWDDGEDSTNYPTAIADGTAETAVYRITVTNTSDKVALYDVVVTDENLGIVDPPLGEGAISIGTLAPKQSVVVVPPPLVGFKNDTRLSNSDICDSPGHKWNQATAQGWSAAGDEAKADDSATVNCIAEPAIRIIKEVSTSGEEDTYFDTVSAISPSDAYYRFTVKNTGNVALVDVKVSDPALFGDKTYTVGSLAIGQEVVITEVYFEQGPSNYMFVDELCGPADDYPNEATVSANVVGSPKTVTDNDVALMVCEEPVNICADDGKPVDLVMQYNGTPESDNHQPSAKAIPVDADLPATASRVEVHACNGGDKQFEECNKLKETWTNVSVGQTRTILGEYGPGGALLPNIVLKIFDGNDEKQRIFLHGSCSEPLFVGDKHGGFTIFDYSY